MTHSSLAIALSTLLGLAVGCGNEKPAVDTTSGPPRVDETGTQPVASREGAPETAVPDLIDSESAEETTQPRPIDSELVAVQTFRRELTGVLPATLDTDIRRFVTGKTTDAMLGARRQPWRACFERVDSVLSATLRPTLRARNVLYGNIEALRDREGDCWEIASSGGLGNELVAYLDQRTGELVFVWIAPEG